MATTRITDIPPSRDGVRSYYITADGMRTHVLDIGTGPPVVLLHSGEYGGCAESSWRALMPSIAAAGYQVIAADWLGFGKSDKVVDFADPKGRRLRHIAALLDQMGFERPALVGSSMGGTYLAQALAADDPPMKASAAVLVSGGGFVPDNDARRRTLEYDLTVESMATILRTMMYSPRLADDLEYVRWRHHLSLEPGAWQCVASARLHPPGDEAPGGEFGKADTTHYERVSVPTLIIAGADDPLREPSYADDLAARIPDSELRTYEQCGHMPNLEHPERFVADLVSFLDQRYQAALL